MIDKNRYPVNSLIIAFGDQTIVFYIPSGGGYSWELLTSAGQLLDNGWDQDVSRSIKQAHLARKAFKRGSEK